MGSLLLRIAVIAMVSAVLVTANTTNSSDGRACEVDATTSSALRELFFDTACLQALDTTVPCPLEEANTFVEEFGGEVRFEGFVLNIMMLLICVSLAQAGGIPVPKDILGKACWMIWFGLVLFQWLTVQCSIGLLIGAYWSATNLLGPCMVPWDVGGSAPLLHAASLPYFFFQARVLFLFAAGAFYTWMTMFALHVFNQTHKIHGDPGDWACPIGCGHARKLNTCKKIMMTVVGQVTNYIMIVPFIVVFVLCFLAWLLTACFLFSFVFFLPTAFGVAAGTVVSILLIRTTRRYIFQPLWSCALGLLPGVITVPAAVRDTTLMFWWLQFEGINKYQGTFAELFQIFMIFVFMVVALSPCVCYGSMLAWYIYGGRSTEDHIELVKLLYSHHFGVFIDSKFEVVALADVWRFMRDCDMECYEEWIYRAFGFFAGFGSLLDLGPVYFLEGSTALMALNFTLNLVKPIVPLINFAIILCQRQSDESGDQVRNITIFEVCSLKSTDTIADVKVRAGALKNVIGAQQLDKE